MSSLLARRLRFYLVFFGALGVVGFIILPPSVWRGGARHNARRASCQSNLKQIGLAIQQYAQDYELPPRRWEKPLLSYVKDERIFQCPETNMTSGTNDYFFNARFVRTLLSEVSDPKTLILVDDGQDDAADAILVSISSTWRTDKNSPAWRHLDTANYLFADGHVKALRVNRVSRDFRVVKP